MLQAGYVKVFIAGGATLAYYFDPDMSRGISLVRLATSYAPATSFGSLCKSSLLLTLLQTMHDVLISSKKELAVGA